jgi:hypothetical protein
MNITKAYAARHIKFIELHEFLDWKIKIYGITTNCRDILLQNIIEAKDLLGEWLAKSEMHNFPTYKMATLILHEGKEGCFAIISWWVDENMLQLHVYLKTKNEFELFFANGIVTCVWEMQVLWHERNAWIKHIMMQHEQPDWQAYLQDTLIDA